MQPRLIKINVREKSSFSITRYVCEEGFPSIWHFHDEYELTQVVQSCGTRMVGDSIDRYLDGDLVLIGRNLPHVWRSDETKAVKRAESLVVHFMRDFLGPLFFKIPEMTKVNVLLERSHRGICISGETKKMVAPLMLKMERQEPADQIVTLLSILNQLARSEELSDLSSEGFANSIDEFDSNRLNKVYEYVMNNFQKNICFSTVAEIANLSPTSFSRYFKNRTRKSFTQFIIEVKIGYACKLLMNGDMTVTQVCYESGFQNLSNFNEQFKSITKLTPKKYQSLHARS
ncbi:MAG: AraC family transcriptional regulator [Chitinophagaceae bacterium]|nr:AraC family transcriptional regulator [Chitinophagaceae bacterium]